jgi:hypothetical protein
MTERIDLSALELSEHRRDILVASVMLQSGHELTRRASGSSPIVFLGTWARPALAAAAVLALVCGTLLANGSRSGTDMTPGAGIAEALGVSSTTRMLLTSTSTPTLVDMIAVSEETQ